MSAGQHQSEFQEFWLAFRRALLSGDTATLQGMIQLPLEVRGELDDEAVRRISGRELQEVFDRVLAADSGLSARERF
jgi:hypothetical protein